MQQLLRKVCYSVFVEKVYKMKLNLNLFTQQHFQS